MSEKKKKRTHTIKYKRINGNPFIVHMLFQLFKKLVVLLFECFVLLFLIFLASACFSLHSAFSIRLLWRYVVQGEYTNAKTRLNESLKTSAKES